MSQQAVYRSRECSTLCCQKKIFISLAAIAAIAVVAVAAVAIGCIGILPGQFGFSATVAGSTLFVISCIAVASVILSGSYCHSGENSLNRNVDEGSIVHEHGINDCSDIGLNHLESADSTESIQGPMNEEGFSDDSGVEVENISGNLSQELDPPSETIQRPSPVRLTDAVRNSQLYEYDQEKIKICVIEQDIKERPEYHLKQVTDLIARYAAVIESPWFDVTFLTIDGRAQRGRDFGGLRRHYISVLFSSVIANSCITFGKSVINGLAFPTINVNGNLDPETQERIRENQLNVCRQLGMLCGFLMEKLPIGGNFDFSFFSALLAFSKSSVNASSIDELSLEEKIRIIHACLFDSRQENESVEREVPIQDQDKLPIFLQTDITTFSREQLQTVFNLASTLSVEFNQQELSASRQHFIDAFGDNVDELLALTEEQHQQIIGDESNRVFIKEILTEMFLEVYSPRLEAFHAFAQGMKAMLVNAQIRRGNPDPDAQIDFADMAWDELCTRYNNVAFAEKLQGSVDPSKIARSIRCRYGENEIIHTQAEWLRNWVNNPLTPLEDIKDFLKFATGVTALPEGQHIEIGSQGTRTLGLNAQNRWVTGYSPTPEAHTCFAEIRLPPDWTGPLDGMNNRTEENFINCIKAVIGGIGTFSVD